MKVILLILPILIFVGVEGSANPVQKGGKLDANIPDESGLSQVEEELVEETPRPFPIIPEDIPIPTNATFPQRVEEIPKNTTTGGTGTHVVGTATCQCGKSITKIVGGDNAKINDLPWTALLYKRGFFGGRSPYCGATLINNLYVLTASHCVDGQSSRSVEVVLKEENTATSTESKSFTFKVSKIIMHPDYSRRTIDNDIALIQLEKPVDLSPTGHFVPACVPQDNNDSFDGQNATAAGWGATRQGGSVSKVLKRVTVPIISNEACDMTKYKGRITPNMLCAGDVEQGGKDSCQGDSGGPLVIDSGDRKIIAGVVSWGYGCAKPNSPGVYTRVSRYPEWIKSQTQDAVWCNE